MPEDDLGAGVSKLTVTVIEDEVNAATTERKQSIFDGLPNTTFPQRQTGRGIDVTTAFNKASASLNQGQLVKDDFFTLFESVGALEIMDPKMDSGYTMPVEDAALEDFDPLDHTLPEEVIWIMDQMLSFEMAWHEGAPLSQTLLTSLHLYNLLPIDYLPLDQMVFRSTRRDGGTNTLITSILRAYCLGLAKCLDSVILEITSEHFYEEEDFISATFSRLYVNKIDESDFTALLETALSDLENLEISNDIQEAIRVRLRLRILMIRAFSPGELIMQSMKPDAFRSIKQLLREVNSTNALGKETSVPVFSERVQRYLASNTPPRPMKKTSWSDTIENLEHMCDDVVAAFDMTQLYPDFDHAPLMRFAWSFSSRLPHPLTYARSIVQGLLFKSSSVVNTLPHLDLLLADIRGLVLPASPILSPSNWSTELPSSPRYLLARKLDDFLTRSLEEYLNLYRMPLQNRCRIRRTFTQSVPILDSLQALAEETDTSLLATCRSSIATRDPIRPGLGEDGSPPHLPLASWVYHHKLLAMETVINLGFELEVYLPDEYASQYALLSFFAQTRAEHYSYLTSHLSQRMNPLPPSPALKPADRAEIMSSVSYLASLAAQARLLSALASALADIYSALMILDLIPIPGRPFSSPELRHELRMKPFLGIGTPALPSRGDLESITTARESGTTIGSICSEADEKLRLAKAEVGRLKSMSPEEGRFTGLEKDWERDWKGKMLVAVQIGVGVAAVREVAKGLGEVSVDELKEGKEREGIKKRVKVEMPKVEDRKQRGWIVPRVVVGK
ncbi:Mak10 subunit-like protein [Elsinoe fawcettii]|nr:Mak10 subunit-like protein [Elsinoe fawcettii]